MHSGWSGIIQTRSEVALVTEDPLPNNQYLYSPTEYPVVKMQSDTQIGVHEPLIGGVFCMFQVVDRPLSIPTQLAHISGPKSLSLYGRVGSETPNLSVDRFGAEKFNSSQLCT